MENMEDIDKSARPQSLMMAVLTDMHFWVPAVVLLGGLLLLGFIR
jgi:hypothetical protein